MQVRRRAELPAAQHRRALRVEAHVRQPLEQAAQRDRLLLARERVARAEVPAEAERARAAGARGRRSKRSGSSQRCSSRFAEAITSATGSPAGIVAPPISTSVAWSSAAGCRWARSGAAPPRRPRGTSPAGSAATAAACSGSASSAASAEPAPCPGSCMPPSRITSRLGRISSRRADRRRGAPACSMCEIAESSGSRSSRSSSGASRARISAATPSPIACFAGIALVVRRALCEPGEPAAQRVAVDVAEPEHLPEAEHADRLEVLGHQLGRAAGREAVEQLVGDRLDQPVDVGVDDARAELRVDRRAQLLVHGAVAGEHRGAAERRARRASSASRRRTARGARPRARRRPSGSASRR